jgi:HAD superfamily hydrolase (TIGR01450 family)
MNLKNFGTFVFDLDGTVWYWTRLIAGVKATIDKLKKSGKTVLYVSNNTIVSRKDLARRLSNFGIETRSEDVMNTGIVIGHYVKEHVGTALALNLGTEKDLKEVGVIVRKRPPVDYVVVTEDWDFDYNQLSLAFDALMGGGKLVTSVMGRHWIVGNKMVPGVGCWVKAVEFAAKTSAIALGKPSYYMVKIVSQRLEYPENTVFVGDEFESDVLFGKRLGCFTVFVNTGMDKDKSSNIKPDLWLESVKDLLRYI